jgi:hypothetical protein
VTGAKLCLTGRTLDLASVMCPPRNVDWYVPKNNEESFRQKCERANERGIAGWLPGLSPLSRGAVN